MSGTDVKLDYDVIIIGAGISGICFAHRLQQQHPLLTYCILEGRSEIGGTWSFFKYPGLRSDSDLFTFGLPWKPWNEPEAIAKGPSIVRYLEDAINDDDVRKHIKLEHKVDQMSWSSKSLTWELQVLIRGSTHVPLRSKFIMLATGYYDYEQALEVNIPGISNFQGPVIHSQFWPKDLDYKDKKVVIIGSGATAITLLPAIAKDAKHTTMLQRSPSYIVSVPSEDGVERVIRATCSTNIGSRLMRLKWIFFPMLFRTWCTWFPSLARKSLYKSTLAALKGDILLDSHFKPSYDPFEQRMCMCPDGDFYETLHGGKGSIATGKIETITPESIKLDSGEELLADIIIQATGLKLRLGGGIDIIVDGAPYEIGKHFVWKGMMLEDLPNLAFSFGYFDAAWTLGVDMTAQLACRVLDRMYKEKLDAVVPRLHADEKNNMGEVQFIPLKSTYVTRALAVLPKYGNKPQWCVRSHYIWEWLSLPFRDVRTGLAPMRAS